ncbi:MAG: GNAT family N-acetyltransferase [Gemmatimonadales bacterium]
MSREVDVVITYLELPALGSAFRPAARELPPDCELQLERPPEAARIAGEMYRCVGAEYYWLDRIRWTDDQWREVVDQPGVELWTARIGARIAGYYELHGDASAVEIKYFGLTPPFIGQGVGGPLLSAAVRRALAIGPGTVKLNTCTLDHPAALANYLARGFAPVRTARERRVLPT